MQTKHSIILFIALFIIVITLIWNVSDAIWSNTYIESLPDFALTNKSLFDDNVHGIFKDTTPFANASININDIIASQQWSKTFICIWLIWLCTFMMIVRTLFAYQKVYVESWKFYSSMVVVLLLTLSTFEMTLYIKNFAMLLVQLLSAFVGTIAFAKQKI